MATILEKLAGEIEIVEWHWLRPHMERDALILVGRNLDLVEAAARISEDDTAQVGAWITTGRLTKPNLEQIRVWEADPTRAFRMLIVQPYVLVQEQPAPSDQKE